jgi:hypothetical protein
MTRMAEASRKEHQEGERKTTDDGKGKQKGTPSGGKGRQQMTETRNKRKRIILKKKKPAVKRM